jgi:hypothetical protein
VVAWRPLEEGAGEGPLDSFGGVGAVVRRPWRLSDVAVRWPWGDFSAFVRWPQRILAARALVARRAGWPNGARAVPSPCGKFLLSPRLRGSSDPCPFRGTATPAPDVDVYVKKAKIGRWEA